jgi:hypothetical protein
VESGQITWSTVFQTHVFAARLGGFAVSRGLSRPALTDDPSQLRAVTLDFRSFLRQWRRERPARGQARGGPLDARSVARTLRFLGNFYATMTDSRHEAAAATGDDGWLALGDGHGRLVRRPAPTNLQVATSGRANPVQVIEVRVPAARRLNRLTTLRTLSSTSRPAETRQKFVRTPDKSTTSRSGAASTTAPC